MRGAIAAAGAWRGVAIQTNNPLNTVAFVDIAHGGGQRWGSTEDEANLYVHGVGRVSVTDSTFTDSQDYGVYFEAGATIGAFTANTFSGNAQAAVRVYANNLGALDTASDYDVAATRGVEVKNESVTTPQTWKALNAKPVFLGVSQIKAAVTIADGADYLFDVNAGIDVETGSLSAIASTANGIHLRGLVAVAGQWRGIIFHSNSPTNALTNVEIRHAGGERFGSTSDQANVYVDGRARLSMTNCLLADSARFGVFTEAAA